VLLFLDDEVSTQKLNDLSSLLVFLKFQSHALGSALAHRADMLWGGSFRTGGSQDVPGTRKHLCVRGSECRVPTAHVDLLLLGVTHRVAVGPGLGLKAVWGSAQSGLLSSPHVPHSSALLLTSFLLGRASVRSASQRRGHEPKVQPATSLVHPPVL